MLSRGQGTYRDSYTTCVCGTQLSANELVQQLRKGFDRALGKPEDQYKQFDKNLDFVSALAAPDARAGDDALQTTTLTEEILVRIFTRSGFWYGRIGKR
jgi:hypothetical protein